MSASVGSGFKWRRKHKMWTKITEKFPTNAYHRVSFLLSVHVPTLVATSPVPPSASLSVFAYARCGGTVLYMLRFWCYKTNNKLCTTTRHIIYMYVYTRPKSRLHERDVPELSPFKAQMSLSHSLFVNSYRERIGNKIISDLPIPQKCCGKCQS